MHAILPSGLYKSFINDLLVHLEKSGLGYAIGTINISSPTDADDVLLIALQPANLQGLLNIAYEFSVTNRYGIHPVKSSVLIKQPSERCKLPELNAFHLGGDDIPITDSFAHLGIFRSGTKSGNTLVQDHINLACRTSYSLVSAGLA